MTSSNNPVNVTINAVNNEAVNVVIDNTDERTSLLQASSPSSSLPFTNGSTNANGSGNSDVEAVFVTNYNTLPQQQQQQQEEDEEVLLSSSSSLSFWPSTYERSIALLSSPILPIPDVAYYTKSPQPGLKRITSLIEARRNQLDRGQYNDDDTINQTPDHQIQNNVQRRPQQRQNDNTQNVDHSGLLRGSLGRVKSMDFWTKTSSISQQQPYMKVTTTDFQEVQIKQEQRINQAQEYRKQILLQQQQQQQQSNHSKSSTKKSSSTTTSSLKTATFYQCTFNLANILMGVGLLGLPYVYSISGYIGGTFCIISFAIITWYTSILIGRTLNGDPQPLYNFVVTTSVNPTINNNNNNQVTKSSSTMQQQRMLLPITSFPDIARTAFGEYGCIILSLILYFELFSCIAIFFVSMGDHLHQLIPNISTTYHMIIVGCISMIPTIVLRTPTLLSYLSMVGTLATTAVVISVIASAFLEGNIAANVVEQEHMILSPPYHSGWKSNGLTLAFGLVAYCFSGHAIIPSIYTSMEKPEEFEKMVTYTFVLVVGCCLSVAFSGYYIFGSTVQDQVTLSLERSSHAVTAMKALTWLMIMTAFSKVTLTMFPLALGMEEIVAPYLSSERMVDIASATIKLLLTIFALCVSIFFPSFSLLCSFVGVICSMTVSVIFPAAAHLKLFGSRLSFAEKVIDWLLIVLGTVMGIAGTVATLH